MVTENIYSVNILVVEDDPDDRFIIKKALAENKMNNDVYYVEDGCEAMDFLTHQGKYSGENSKPKPGLILLDLNMPKKDGLEVLKEVRNHPDLRRIPVIILTTSKAEEDIFRSYDLGVNSFITKPVSFEALLSVVQSIGEYWFEIVSRSPR